MESLKIEDVIIIGGGLSGLSTGYYLKKESISFKILEAQNRLGGRIKTVFGTQNTPMEMGATWFGKDHKNLIYILSELNIGYFEQHNEGIALFETMSFEPPQQYFVPANTHSAYRIQGGSYSIIEALYQNIGKENVVLNTEIIEIVDEDDIIKITDSAKNIFLLQTLNHFYSTQIAYQYYIVFTCSAPYFLSSNAKNANLDEWFCKIFS